MTIQSRIQEAASHLRSVRSALVLARHAKEKGFVVLQITAHVQDGASPELDDAMRSAFFKKREELMSLAVDELERQERAAERALGDVALEMVGGAE